MIVDSYDLLLNDPEIRARFRPGIVLRSGHLPSSKPLLSLLQSCALTARHFLIAEDGTHVEPHFITSDVAYGDLSTFCRKGREEFTEEGAR